MRYRQGFVHFWEERQVQRSTGAHERRPISQAQLFGGSAQFGHKLDYLLPPGSLTKLKTLCRSSIGMSINRSGGLTADSIVPAAAPVPATVIEIRKVGVNSNASPARRATTISSNHASRLRQGEGPLHAYSPATKSTRDFTSVLLQTTIRVAGLLTPLSSLNSTLLFTFGARSTFYYPLLNHLCCLTA